MAIKHFFTPAEIAIMDALVFDELSPKEIAQRRCVALTTVRFHITNIQKAYDTNSTTVACLRYLKESFTDQQAKEKRERDRNTKDT